MINSNTLGGRRNRRKPVLLPGQRQINNQQKALIHVAKAQLGMDEDSYRQLLGSFGVQSSTELTERQFHDLLKHLERLGFQKKSRPPLSRLKKGEDVQQKPKHYKKWGLAPTEPLGEKERYLAAIERLLLEKNLPWNYAHRIGENMFGAAKLDWLSAEQMHKVMVALIYHKKRDKGTGKREEAKT